MDPPPCSPLGERASERSSWLPIWPVPQCATLFERSVMRRRIRGWFSSQIRRLIARTNAFTNWGATHYLRRRSLSLTSPSASIRCRIKDGQRHEGFIRDPVNQSRHKAGRDVQRTLHVHLQRIAFDHGRSDSQSSWQRPLLRHECWRSGSRANPPHGTGSPP